MKTLVLMRHAKTEPFNSRGDHSRQLLQLGRDQCSHAAPDIGSLGLDLVLASTAKRTRQTAELLGLTAPIEHLDELYNCGADDWLTAIGELDESVRSLLCVGHAPAIPWLAAELAHRCDPQAAGSIGDWFPTATWVQFQIESRWDELASTPRVDFVGVHRPLKD